MKRIKKLLLKKNYFFTKLHLFIFNKTTHYMQNIFIIDHYFKLITYFTWFQIVWRYFYFNSYTKTEVYRFSSPKLLNFLTTYIILSYTIFFKQPRIIYMKNHLYEESYSIVYINYINNRVLSLLFNKKIYIFIIKNLYKYLSLIDLFYFHLYLNKIPKTRFKFINYFNQFEFFKIIFLSLRFLNFNWLIDFFQKIIKKMIIFKHKTFFSFFFMSLTEKFRSLLTHFNIYGIFISIKGKIGVGGNSRKRRKFLNIGSTSRYTQTTVVTHFANHLNTTSGALGFKLWVFSSKIKL